MSTLLVRKKLSMALLGVTLMGFLVTATAKTAQAFSLAVYTDKAEWQKALNGQPFQTETFDESSLQPNIHVTSTTGTIKAGSWEDQVSKQPLQVTQWQFTQPLFAWGANFNLSPNDPGAGVTVIVKQLLGNQHKSNEIPNTYSGDFWGLVADEDFNTVNFEVGTQNIYRETYTMDNMVYAEPVPEPTTTLGILVFSSFLAGVWRKRQQLKS